MSQIVRAMTAAELEEYRGQKVSACYDNLEKAKVNILGFNLNQYISGPNGMLAAHAREGRFGDDIIDKPLMGANRLIGSIKIIDAEIARRSRLVAYYSQPIQHQVQLTSKQSTRAVPSANIRPKSMRRNDHLQLELPMGA